MNPDDNPFRSPNERAAVVQPSGQIAQVEQQRAVVEMQARILMARRNPRDVVACMDQVLSDCERPSVAELAVYTYARGGTDISGPSIRLAEGIARRWGNIASGFKIVEQTGQFSEVVAYAWDLETGYYDERAFRVKHWRDTKKGGYPLTDERDIYELVANMAQRRKRAVLLSVLPGDVVDAAQKKCEQTMKARADTSPEGMAKMVEAFKEFHVSRAQIEARIQRRLDAISPAQVVSLKKVYASLRDGMGTAADFFAPDPAAEAGGVGSGGTDGFRPGEEAPPQTPAQRVKDALKKTQPKGKGAPVADAGPDAPDEAVKTMGELEQESPEGFRNPPSEQAQAEMADSAALLRDRLMKAKDRDAAWLVLDAARSMVPPVSAQEHEALVTLLESRFPEAEA